MSIDESAMLLSGQMARNELGTFYFDQPGVWIDKEGHPDGNHLHRTDGPAVIWYYGTQEWWVNGRLHREDGPAVTRVNGHQEWWFNGVRIK